MSDDYAKMLAKGMSPLAVAWYAAWIAVPFFFFLRWPLLELAEAMALNPASDDYLTLTKTVPRGLAFGLALLIRLYMPASFGSLAVSIDQMFKNFSKGGR